jgi:hypothetical protein
VSVGFSATGFRAEFVSLSFSATRRDGAPQTEPAQGLGRHLSGDVLGTEHGGQHRQPVRLGDEVQMLGESVSVGSWLTKSARLVTTCSSCVEDGGEDRLDVKFARKGEG